MRRVVIATATTIISVGAVLGAAEAADLYTTRPPPLAAEAPPPAEEAPPPVAEAPPPVEVAPPAVAVIPEAPIVVEPRCPMYGDADIWDAVGGPHVRRLRPRYTELLHTGDTTFPTTSTIAHTGIIPTRALAGVIPIHAGVNGLTGKSQR